MSLIKQMRSNSQNWSRIESKVLYLIQLWYDAFILQQSKYPYIINNYKILRKQNIIFPPRNVNEKSLLVIQTNSPIFDNIQTIAEQDKQKFKKKLRAMGLSDLSKKFQDKDITLKTMPNTNKAKSKQIDIDEISEKIAIIQSQDYDVDKVLKVIEQVQWAIEEGVVKPNQQNYWKQVKRAAQNLILEWQTKNNKIIRARERQYLESKINGPKSQVHQIKSTPSYLKEQAHDVDLLGDQPVVQKKEQKQDDWGQFDNGNTNTNQHQNFYVNHNQQNQIKIAKQMDLLDL